ncbi:hypothetical protein ABW19_dt0204205 [Dactylella cylindrospora]|nr:hypothetical protein ABW19_dt0204205 [Dactylella cylindrospora]
MSDESAPEVLVYGNVTETDFYTASLLCQDLTWLVRYSMPNVKAYDLAVKFTEWYNGVENASLAVPEFVEFTGAREVDVETVYTFYGGGDVFAMLTAYTKDLVPLFDHPTQDSDLYIGIFVFLTFFALLSLGLRLYSRVSIAGYVKSYDWILVVATVITFAFGLMNAVTLAGPFHHRGYWDRSWNNYDTGNAAGIASDVLYPVVVLLIKSSLLLFYWSLTQYWPLRASVLVTFAIVFANSMCMIFIWVFKSDPVLYWRDDAYWTANVKAVLWEKSELVCGGINIVTDVMVWVLPLPMIWKIRQSLRERLLTCATFGVGALACIACGIRLHSIREINKGGLVPPNQTPYLLWTMTELYLAIICSSVPALRALIIKKAPSVLGASADSATYSDDKDIESKVKEKNGIAPVVKPASPTSSE